MYAKITPVFFKTLTFSYTFDMNIPVRVRTLFTHEVSAMNPVKKHKTNSPASKNKAAVPRLRLAFLLTGTALYSDAALLFSDSLTASGMVAYLFTLTAFMIELYICCRCANAADADSVPVSLRLHQPVTEAGWRYCLFQACMGIIFTFLMPALPVWIPLLACGAWFFYAMITLRV